MRIKTANVLFAAAVLATPVQAQAPDRSRPPDLGPAPSLNLPEIQRFELSNGLRVMLMEKHNVPLVQVDLVVHSGTVDDPRGKTGLASLTAAMMDEGAGDRDALELADAIEFLGADILVGAGLHVSWVDLHTPLAQLEPALELYADVILRPTFAAEELDRQRRNRLTSIMQWHDEARVIASQMFNRVLFGDDHPYGVPGFGTPAGLNAISSDDLREHHATHYTPGNSDLVIVGDVSPESIIPLLENAFGEWRGDAPQRTNVPAASQVGGRRIYLVDKPGAAQSEIRIGRIGADRFTVDYYSLQVMNTILGGSFASRLNMNLREEHGYSYGARSSFSFRPTAGPFLASAAVQTDVTDSALVEFIRELNGILEPVSDEEIERGRNFVALRFPGRFQTVVGIANRLSELVTYNLPDDYFNRYIDNILAVTKDEVREVARDYLDSERMAIIVVGDRERILAGIEALQLGEIELFTIEDVLGPPPTIE